MIFINHFLKAVILILMILTLNVLGVSSKAVAQQQKACSSPLFSKICGSSWRSACRKYGPANYSQITIDFRRDGTFLYTGRVYSDTNCSKLTSSLAFSGVMAEGPDIVLLNGTTASRFDFHVNFYDGAVINPVNIQYSILQADKSDPNIIWLGSTHDTAQERDMDKRVRSQLFKI